MESIPEGLSCNSAEVQELFTLAGGRLSLADAALLLTGASGNMPQAASWFFDNGIHSHHIKRAEAARQQQLLQLSLAEDSPHTAEQVLVKASNQAVLATCL